MRVIMPPTFLPSLDAPSVFLAGSIEMGEAADWQRAVIEALADTSLVVFNPRRAQWDASWPQTLDDPRFRGQVEWELEGLDRADLVAMYLDPSTRAPVSLLELGLHATGGRLVVCCPEGYWRKGNVDAVCRRYGVMQVPTLAALIEVIRERLEVSVD